MGNLSKISILIVDDSKHIRRLLDVMLRNMGCQTLIEAKNIAQATDALERKAIDIVLLDWILDDPSGDGLTVLKAIRTSPVDEVRFMPVIMMTGHTERENIETARDLGVTEFLAKPFTAKNLHTRISLLIDSPRPYVKTRRFFGPDRRRRESGTGSKGERRHITPRKDS